MPRGAFQPAGGPRAGCARTAAGRGPFRLCGLHRPQHTLPPRGPQWLLLQLPSHLHSSGRKEGQDPAQKPPSSAPLTSTEQNASHTPSHPKRPWGTKCPLWGANDHFISDLVDKNKGEWLCRQLAILALSCTCGLEADRTQAGTGHTGGRRPDQPGHVATAISWGEDEEEDTTH